MQGNHLHFLALKDGFKKRCINTIVLINGYSINITE